MAVKSLNAARALRTVAFVATLCAPAVAQPPAKAPEPKANRNLDSLKIPPGTVIVISDNPREAFQHVDAIVLSPDEYRRLVEASEQAKRPAVPDKSEVPSVCRIGGKVEARGSHEVALLRVTYAFRTTAARTVVQLGLQKGKPTAARFADGKLPVLLAGKEDEGLSAQVDGVGEHALTVDVEVPLASRGSKGGERGFELGLPGAAITTVEKLELPDGAARVRIGGRSVALRTLTQPNAAFILGPVPRLELAWDVPMASGPVDLQMAAEGVAEVRIDEKTVTTQTRLNLKVQRGAAATFRVQTPPNSELTTDGNDSATKVERPKDGSKSVWVVRREPSADELRLDVVTRADMKPNEPVHVILPRVADAGQQRGTISVTGPPTLRLAVGLKSGAELARREGGEDSTFAYSRVPDGPLLEIEVRAHKGEVETTVGHQFSLAEGGWRWQGRIDVRPVRAEVGYLDIDLPPELQDFRPTSAELVDSVKPIGDADAPRKVVRLQLAEPRRKPFAITVEGLFPIAPGTLSANLMLPRIAGTLDRGGTLATTVPTGMEVRATLRDWERDRVGEWERALDAGPRGPTVATATFDRTPARLDVSWRSPRGDVATTAMVHVFLGERQATVRHTWALPDGTRKYIVRGPATLTGRLRIIAGGTATATSPGEWSVQATAGNLVLTYSFLLPTGESPNVVVPLAWLEPCPRCETELRVWAGPTFDPTQANGPWTELPPQPVAEQPDLPTLSLHGSGSQLPLTLGLRARDAGADAAIEKQWAQVALDGDGTQTYRVRAWVRPGRGRQLAIELPSGIDATATSVLLDGKRVSAGDDPTARRWHIPTDAGTGHGPRLVELLYVRRPEGNAVATSVELPEYVGVEPPPTRVQVAVPPNSVALARGECTFAESLNWDRLFPMLRPSKTTADIGAWFGVKGRPVETDPTVADTLNAGLLATSAAGGNFRVVVISRPLLMLIASAVVLLAFAAVAAPSSAWTRAVRATTIGAVLAALAVAAPHAAGRVSLASLPGLLAVPVIVGVRAYLQRRHRQRLLMLPGFSRDVPTGRTANGFAARREPSTVDAPDRLAERSSSRQVVG